MKRLRVRRLRMTKKEEQGQIKCLRAVLQTRVADQIGRNKRIQDENGYRDG